MGVEMIKDRQAKEHLVFTDEDFYNDDIMGSKFEDYEILQVLSNKDDKKKEFVSKVRSKFNSKIYAMKKIDSQYIQNEQLIRNEFMKLTKMSFPNVTKYFKYFIQDSCLYVIYEYVNNGDLSGFIEAYKSLKKPVDSNTLWNIFMQCISALRYIHNQNIIHKNISLTNIFMTESTIVKLGDFKFSFLDNCPPKEEYKSPEMKSNLKYDQKTDIYALGVVFHQLCYFAAPNNRKSNERIYPQEMETIIQLMLKNEKERPDANYLYSIIMEQYIKNVARITSIDSVFRCMYAFQNLTQIMYQNVQTYSNESKTPVAFNYVNCIQRYFSGENQTENAIDLNNFRNLFYNNSQINNEIEIKPSLVTEFLLEKLNKETSVGFMCPSFGIQTSNFDKDKNQSFNAFYSYFKSNFTSLIAKFFVGFIKTKRICTIQTCREGLYSFNLFPFIEFDLDMVGDSPNLPNWFFTQNNNCFTLTADHNFVCQKCKCIRAHHEFKQFYQMPQNFIISLNRGEGFRNTMNVQFPLVLDLNQMIEINTHSKFNLVGIIKRIVDNKGFEYYIALYLDFTQNSWMASEKGKITKIGNPLNHNNGMVMQLFYYSPVTSNFGS